MTLIKTALGKIYYTPKGEYDNAKTYDPLDVVTFEGSSFLFLKQSTGIPPTGDNIVTMLLAKKGDKGDTGNTGETGETGADGLTAYQVAVKNGFEGTESEWIASLKGDKGDTGDKGETGDTGNTGLSAYEIAVENGFVGTEAEWVDSLKGDKGDKGDTGEKGEKGDNFAILGFYPTLEALKAGVPSPADGVAYGVGSAAPYDIYIYDGVGEDWVNNGALQGAKGDKGDTGDKGNDGLSAYQVAVNNGFQGTEAEWLASLKGAKGDTGEKGDDGVKGDTGDKGEDGKDGKSWACPDLDDVPDENTLTYEQGGETIAFVIGDEARVLDTEKEEYVFYKLYDLADGKAEWKIAGSGGDVDLREQLTIKLISNQAQPDTALIGAEITVEIGGVTDVHTWNGTDIKLSLVAATECRVSVSKIDGYSQPAEQSFTTGISNVRSIEFAYNCCVLTVDLTSNQTDKTDIANAKATVKYGTTTKTLTLTNNTVKVPHSETITISYSDVTNYKKPGNVSRTFTTANETITASWLTEAVNIIVSADNAASMVGQTVTVKNSTSGTVLLSTAWAGSTIVLKVPFDTGYEVSCDERAGFTQPEPQTYIANTASRAISMQYEKVQANYITIDQTITDPATMISGDINGEVIQWIRNNSHRYLGKYTAAGKMTVCQLNDTDGTKYADGTTAVLTGTEGDVWMKLPRFFYHAEEIETDVWKIGFGLDKVDNTWKEWDGTDLIGVYEVFNSGSKAYSRSGVESTRSVSQANWKTYARARGDGYTLVKHKHQNIMGCLFYAMYGNTNCQALIGSGTNSYTKINGDTNALGMVDTQAATNGNSQSINFWGLENWWGNKYEWLDNVVYNPVSGNGVWRVTEDDGTTRDVQGAVTNSWVYPKKMVIGENLDLVVKTTDAASDTTGYCDAQYTATGTNLVVLRSCSNSNAHGGVACAYAGYASSSTHTYYGSRLAFRGEITEAESVAAYKAIAVTN